MASVGKAAKQDVNPAEVGQIIEISSVGDNVLMAAPCLDNRAEAIDTIGVHLAAGCWLLGAYWPTSQSPIS